MTTPGVHPGPSGTVTPVETDGSTQPAPTSDAAQAGVPAQLGGAQTEGVLESAAAPAETMSETVPAETGPDAAVDPSARTLNWVPLVIVLVFFLIGVALVIARHWRRGTVTMGASLLIGAALRLILPTSMAGLLAVRSRQTDCAILAGMGVAMMILGMAVPGVYI